MEFKKYKISDIAEVVGGGTPSTKKTEYYGGDIAWLTPKDLSNFKKRYISKGERSLTTLGLQSSSARLMPANTVLFTSRAPIGYVAISKNNISTNQGFKSLICREDKVLPEYMYYLMKFNTPVLENQATGSTFKEVSGTLVKNFEVLIPNIHEQKKIIDILGSLDSKIELNSDSILKLEDISRILFKQWFVDFEFPNKDGKPYKSSGGEMIDSELGNVPAGWNTYNVGDFVESISQSINKKEKKSAKFLNTSDILAGEIKEVNFLPTNDMPGQAKKMIKKNDILFSEIRPKNRRYAYVDMENPQDYVVSTKLMVLRINEELFSSKLFYIWLTLPSTINELNHIAESRSGTFPQITFSIISKLKLALPPKKHFTELEASFIAMFYKINELRLENKALSKLRDTLLPKLLSGELDNLEKLEV